MEDNHYATTIKPEYFETDRAEFPEIRLRKTSNKRKKQKNKRKPKNTERNEVVDRKIAKRKYGKRFVKTSLRDDTSASKEIGRGKPVDIIVHIKMTE
ncbi:unnamed protein product [Leptosia nina]|uniref:Uncharacterized protein n=1 Tax=Leptosia nina TaxID=320188 RepID=A0AAV1IZC8_9NEOP